ncbi:DHHC palmitoyltransferase-domain-containing protein [Mucor mucedo]|nr:DHHC palmitoyltransferase-domain-containing protein [Mucor mucedo]KAI7894937.1 DHHC palmitoyltransferase-domain-containing protein [Mucor mucedo]
MKCPSCASIQRAIMAFVNASPVILLLLIFIWSYWAFNFSLCYNLVSEGHGVQGSLYILFYHPLFILCMWSYWVVCRTSPGYTLDMYKKRDEERDEDVGLLTDTFDNNVEEQDKQTIAVLNIEEDLQHSPLPITVKRDGARRYCQKCKLEKFDRTHHCRQCNRCVLKMDHHCPWINNCVGFYNYKSFYLFLVYASMYCVFVFGASLPPTLIQASGPMSILGLNLNCALLVFISGIFGLFLVPFTIFHTRQLCKNRTTIEYYEKANYRLGNNNNRVDIMRSKYFNPWDLGTRKNVQQVLGKDLIRRFIPIGKAVGDGSSFPINNYAYDTLGADDMSD